MNAKGSEQQLKPHDYPIADTNTTIHDSQEMWDKLIRRHRNMFMTINGHVLNDGLGFLTSRGDHGNGVHQMLLVGGEARLRILTFQPDRETIRVQDHSPRYERFSTSPDNQFSVAANACWNAVLS